MRIENLKLEKNGDHARIVSTVIWEDISRARQELFFETTSEFADGLACHPHPFLVACIMPAMHFGEKRVAIEGEVCPELKDGLITAMKWMRLWWYHPTKRIVTIDAKIGSGNYSPNKSARAGVFFSGGIDALATLRTNRLNYPLSHPGSIKDGLLICGLEIRDKNIFQYVIDSVSVLAEDAGITLIPIFTNLRALGPENESEFWDEFWAKQFMGAALSAVGHSLSDRLGQLYINASDDMVTLAPYSTHPLIDPNFSSSGFRIRYEGIALSRFEKTKLVAGWDLALKHLRVCNQTREYQPGILNCCNCEKCLRTMLSLVGLGVLDKASAFRTREVSEELLRSALHLKWDVFIYYPDIIASLSDVGRHDLVHALKSKISTYYKNQKKEKLRKAITGPIAEFDQKNLGGFLKKMKGHFFS